MTTIRKRWLKILISVGLFAIIVTTFIFGFFMRQFFIDFTRENYINQIDNIKNQAQMIFEDENSINRRQLSLTLEDYLEEPITNIKILDPYGRVIISVGSNGMMGHMQMMNPEVDTFEILVAGELKGILRIERSSAILNSIMNRQFTRTLLFNSIISGLSVLILLVIASFYISREMSSELIKTAENAKYADSKLLVVNKPSRIKEIFDIQLSLSQLSKKLKLKEKLRKEAIDSIVHQSHTPLTVLRSNIEGLIDEIILPDQNRYEILMAQVDQLILLLDTLDERILTVGDSITVAIKQMNIFETLEKLVKGLELKFEKKGLNLFYNFTGSQVIESDESLIVQIVYNLLNNAYKYTDGGEVALEITVDEQTLIIKVKDTGKGISASDYDKIFEAYYRVNHTSNNGQGLGLYIVKNNVKALNGNIFVDSEINQGTTITVSLPRKNEMN